MRTSSAIAAAAVLVAILVPGRALGFGVSDVLRLQRQQAPDSVIVSHIEQSHHAIHVSARDFRRLERAGVSDRVMGALADAEQGPWRYGTPRSGAPPVYVHYPFDPLPYRHARYAFGFSFHPRNW